MNTTRTRWILKDVFLGACLAGIGAVLVWHLYPGFWKAPDGAAQELALQRRSGLQLAAQQDARAVPAPVPPVAAPSLCDWPPLMQPSSARDGGERAEHPFPGGPRARAKVFLKRAEVAMAQGRLRDAEVALLASCREYAKASANPSLPLARVLDMLGDGYAAGARSEASWVLREQLMARARDVVSVGAQAYASALGPNASRSKLARERVAALMAEQVGGDAWEEGVEPRPRDIGASDQLATAGAPAADRAGGARRSGIEPERQRPAPEPMAQPPAPQAVDASAGVADDELGQLGADLARLHEQAGALTDDPAGFGQRSAAALARRDACQDAGCLREWYAQRRRELLAEF